MLEGPPLGPGGEDITWPDQVPPRGRKASSTRKIRPQTSNMLGHRRPAAMAVPFPMGDMKCKSIGSQKQYHMAPECPEVSRLAHGGRPMFQVLTMFSTCL